MAFRFRPVPENTNIKFMRGRFVGLAVSAVLSLLSIFVFFYPGLHYGIDFEGGIMVEIRTAAPADLATLRSGLGSLGLGEVALQEFGSDRDVLIRVQRQDGDEARQNEAVTLVREKLVELSPGVDFRRVEMVGPRVSSELYRDAFLAIALALMAMMLYIWFRFEWQFGVGAVVTLILDVTKLIGFYGVTQMEFNLTAVAAVLTVIGYSINDKVVVYDRMRENLRKYKTMPLRELIDLSINATLTRTIYTSVGTVLAMLPMAIAGGSAVSGFAIAMIFGIIVGTSSSIFIAAPILLFLGEGRLRPAERKAVGSTAATTTPG